MSSADKHILLGRTFSGNNAWRNGDYYVVHIRQLNIFKIHQSSCWKWIICSKTMHRLIEEQGSLDWRTWIIWIKYLGSANPQAHQCCFVFLCSWAFPRCVSWSFDMLLNFIWLYENNRQLSWTSQGQNQRIRRSVATFGNVNTLILRFWCLG